MVAARFGHLVRIVSTPATEQAGLAGLVGEVLGETNPSVSGVPVIGNPEDDFALNVHFQGREESRWFTVELVEFLDHRAGATLRLDGAPKESVRPETGKWREKDLPSTRWRRFLARLRGHD